MPIKHLLGEEMGQLCRGCRNSSSKISYSTGSKALSMATLFIRKAGNCVMAGTEFRGLWGQRRGQAFLGIVIRVFLKELFELPFKDNSTEA